nr:GEM-interacting protein-like [Salvelinus alpinus]
MESEEEPQVKEKEHSKTPDVKVPNKSKTKRYSEIFRDFDNFELSLVNSTVEEMFPDPDSQSIAETVSTETTDNTELDHVTCEDVYPPDGDDKDGGLSAQEADLALCRCEGGVELALQYAKMWCRYAKDLLAWMEKRISLEQEFAKNIIKAAETAKSCVAQQDMMPLQYIYTMALEHDVKTSQSTKQTSELLQQRCYQARQQYLQRSEDLKDQGCDAKAGTSHSGHKTPGQEEEEESQKQPLQTFTFQEFVPQNKSGRRKTSNPSSLQDSFSLPEESLVNRKGYSDSESIGGSLESLSSPGKPVCFI